MVLNSEEIISNLQIYRQVNVLRIIRDPMVVSGFIQIFCVREFANNFIVVFLGCDTNFDEKSMVKDFKICSLEETVKIIIKPQEKYGTFPLSTMKETIVSDVSDYIEFPTDYASAKLKMNHLQEFIENTYPEMLI